MSKLTPSTLKRWQRRPESFIEEMIRDPETGAPYKLLQAEKRFLRHAIKTGRDGRLQLAEWLYAAPKKSGKTAWAAIITITVIIVYGGKNAEGYCCANDLEQSTGRVFAAIRKIVEASPDLYDLTFDVQTRRHAITERSIRFPATGASITAMANDYAGAAGANPTITVFDELWAYTSERSRRLWDEMVPPPTRKFAARLTVTYAGFSGESVLLEELYARGTSQPKVATDMYAGDGILAFWSHRPIAPWQTPAWIEQMRGSLRPNAFLRLIENRFTSNEEAFIDVEWWDECTTVQPVAADNRLPVWVGVDASVKRDSTAVVAVTYDREERMARMVAHRIFQPSPDKPLNFENTVEWAIKDLRNRFRVKAVWYDPYQMAAVAQRLLRASVPMIEFSQTIPNLTEASNNLYELIRARQLAVYPDDAIRLAAQRAIASEGARGWKIAKEKQSHKIDVVVALAMAALAAMKGAHKPQLRVGALAPDYAPTSLRRRPVQPSRVYRAADGSLRIPAY